MSKFMCESCLSTCIDPNETVQFLEKTKEKVKVGEIYRHISIYSLVYMQVKNSIEASVLCLTAIGTVKLNLRLLDDVKVSVCFIAIYTHYLTFTRQI